MRIHEYKEHVINVYMDVNVLDILPRHDSQLTQPGFYLRSKISCYWRSKHTNDVSPVALLITYNISLVDFSFIKIYLCDDCFY